MRSTIHRVDVVGEGEHVLRVRVVVLERDLNGRLSLASLDVDRAAVQCFLVPVQVAHEGLQSTLEVERALAVHAFVDQGDPDALGQVGGLADALADRVERVLRGREDLRVGTEARHRAPTLALRALLLDRGGGLAADVLLRPDVPIARRFDAHPRGQGVDHAHADAVEAPGDLVAAAAELAAGVQDRVDDLQRILARRVLADGHPPAVVLDDDHAIRLDRDVDRGRVARHGLVDRVVHDLPDEVMEPAIVRGADVHPRPATDSLQPFQDLDARGVVVTGRGSSTLAATDGVACAVGAGRSARSVRGRSLRARSVRTLGDGFLGHAVPPVRRSYSRPSSSSL